MAFVGVLKNACMTGNMTRIQTNFHITMPRIYWLTTSINISGIVQPKYKMYTANLLRYLHLISRASRVKGGRKTCA